MQALLLPIKKRKKKNRSGAILSKGLVWILRDLTQTLLVLEILMHHQPFSNKRLSPIDTKSDHFKWDKDFEFQIAVVKEQWTEKW